MSLSYTLIISLEINWFDHFIFFENNQILKRRIDDEYFIISYNFYQTTILTVLLWIGHATLETYLVPLNDLFQDNLGFVEAAKTCDSAGYHLAYEIDQEAARSGDYFLSPLKETIYSTIHMGRSGAYFSRGGGLIFFLSRGARAQHPLGPENPLKSIDCTGPGGA